MSRKSADRLTVWDSALLFIIFWLLFGWLLVLIPASCFPDSSPVQRARQEMASMQVALFAYNETYGRFPFPNPDNGPKRKMIGHREYDELMELLTCEDGPDPGSSVLYNARKTRFLEAPALFSERGFVDPWGERYCIIIDADRDGVIQFSGEEVKQPVIIYSSGENKKNEWGKNDDFCSR